MTASRRALIVVGVLSAVALGLPWGGAVPNAAAQEVLVTDAVPRTADQGTLNLDVTITGGGFARRANAKFYLAGTTNPAGVTVNSTRFVNSSKLVANINVAAGAVPGDFDIEVKNADGRTGKGTELFTVIKKIDPCLVPDPVTTRTLLTSDVPGYPGFLDGRFGADTGQVVSPLGFSGSRGAIQVVEGESRIVRAGKLDNSYCTNDGQNTLTWVVVRYRPTGELDATFGDGGVVTTTFTGGSAYAADVAIDKLNRIVVVGAAPPKRGASRVPTVARYNEDGSLDTGFGNGGIAAIPFGRDGGYANALVLQSDGKIVMVATVSGAPNLAVIRLDSQGALDGSFNFTGKFVDTHVAVSIGVDVTTQSVEGEERIVVVGRLSQTTFNTHWLGALYRFTATGAPDAAFGSAGLVLTDFNPTGRYENSGTHSRVVVDGENRLVAALNLSTWQPDLGRAMTQAAVARFLDTGSPDTSFGDTGVVVLPGSATPSKGSSSGRAVAIQLDGRILVAGTDRAGPDGDPSEFAAWRLADDGSLDSTFGNGGWISHPVTTEPRSTVGVGSVVEGPDGTYVVLGSANSSNGWVPYGFLARFWQ